MNRVNEILLKAFPPVEIINVDNFFTSLYLEQGSFIVKVKGKTWVEIDIDFLSIIVMLFFIYQRNDFLYFFPYI